MRKLKMEMKSDCVTAMVQDKMQNEGARQRSKVYRETNAQASYSNIIKNKIWNTRHK